MNTNYHELIDLIHIPEVNQELAALLENLENKHAVTVINLEFENKREYYFKTLFLSDPDYLDDKKGFSFHWFELIKTDNWNWEFKLTYPKKPIFIPQDIIEQIADTLVNPNQVVTMNGILSKIEYIMMNLQIVHYSSNYIFGTFKRYIISEEPVGFNKMAAFKKAEIDMLRTLLMLRDAFPDEIDYCIKKYLTLAPTIPLSRHKRKGVYDLVNIPLRNKHNPFNELKNFPLNRGEETDSCGMQRLMKMIVIPGINERLMLKWQEIKEGCHKKTIQAYKIDKERLYKYLFTDRNLKRNTAKDSPQLYWFELTALTANDWKITRFDPNPPIYEFMEEILPDEFLNLVHYAKPDGKVIKCIYEFKQPSWRKLDIWWIRYSPNCVMGSVCEHTEDLDQLKVSYDALLKGNSNINRGHLYRLFVYHLRSQWGYKKSFEQILEFIIGCINHLQPLVQQRELKK